MLATLVLRKKQIKKAQTNGLESHSKDIQKQNSQMQSCISNGNHATQSETIIMDYRSDLNLNMDYNIKQENIQLQEVKSKDIETNQKAQPFHCSKCSLNFNSK